MYFIFFFTFSVTIMDYVNFLFRPVNTSIVFQIPHANEPLKKIDWHDYKKIAEDEQRKGTLYMYTKTENRDIQQFTTQLDLLHVETSNGSCWYIQWKQRVEILTLYIEFN